MSWNYRVVKRGRGENVYFDIREVYYDNEGNVQTTAVDPGYPGGETIEELASDIEHMKAALLKPVLSVDKFKESSSESPKTSKLLRG